MQKRSFLRTQWKKLKMGFKHPRLEAGKTEEKDLNPHNFVNMQRFISLPKVSLFLRVYTLCNECPGVI